MTEQAYSRPARSARGGPDRITVALFSATAFLLVLALLGTQLSRGSSTRAAARTPVLIRRIYRTTVVERVLPTGSGGAGGRSVSQSVSGSSEPPAPAVAPVTRVS
ncbi:MAG TPA: hypothetical protein VES65_09000 [Solirubrobacteraceae bacterium]|nr:hypothetical protein [Solirubrobacteraceae bacterium]